jgi:ATP-dependent 26S proteasome regulatory subunit
MLQMEELLRYLRCGYSVFHIPTTEEARIHRILEKTAALHFGGSKHVFATWNIVDGWNGRGIPRPKDSVTSPKNALSFIEASGNGFYILNDFGAFLHKPDLQRSLRNLCAGDPTSEKFIFLVSSDRSLPDGLTKEIICIEFNPPSIQETEWILTRWIEATGNDHLGTSIGKIVLSFRGMSEPAIRHLLKGAEAQRVKEVELLRQIYAEKKLHVSLMSDGILEFVPPNITATQVGGLHNAKEWLEKRKHFFSDPELATKVKPPKGLLAMGVSGCGKSLLVKAIPAIWNVPLFRLKMGMVFAGNGTPEERFFRVLRILEDIAPCVVWADEFEKLFPGMDERYQSTAGSSDSRIFSEFLTFMEEKNPYLFVAATCNRIEALPAEVLRKGRFDAVFFVDLPCDDERYEILQVHMGKQGLDPAAFDLDGIVLRTKGWNGAELEELVSRVQVESLAEDKPVRDEVMFSNIEITKPLSLTAAEQISKMQRWALGRATPASKFSSLSRKRMDAKKQVA